MKLIPDELRRAHEDGKVVFFCGAGVSVPAKLPNFKKLTKHVLQELLSPVDLVKPGSIDEMAWKAYDGERYDEALNILEHPRRGFSPKDVREVVRRRLSKRARTLNNHVILSRLADLDKPEGRLITTNFDRFFDNALTRLRRSERSEGTRHKVVTHIAPALPPGKPELFSGLIFLHSKLGASKNNSDLVLTTTDFGNAYLLDGWARRFVVDLFRHYNVIFVGYRVEDPTMHYLVSAIAAARESEEQFIREPYAFAPFRSGDSPGTREEAILEWELKGLTPLPYNSENGHQELWRGLENWANDHRQGVVGRQQNILRLGKFPPSPHSDTEALDEMAWALKETSVAKFAANLDAERPHPGWIKPLHEKGLLNLAIATDNEGADIASPLVSNRLPDNLALDATTFHLGRWISKCISTQEALDWALENGGVLHWAFRREIKIQLKKMKSDIPPALQKIWRVLAEDSYAHARSANWQRMFPNYPKIGPGNFFANRTFLERLRPLPIFNVKSDLFREFQDSAPSADRPKDWCDINIHLVGIEHGHEVSRFRDNAENWTGALAELAEDITTRLKEAMDWHNEFGLADSDSDPASFEYRSISVNDQNEHAKAWTQLIALSRDSFDALADQDPVAARNLIGRWHSLRYPVFRRLALYGATGGANA